jgi:DNA-binding transcriptional LysR family regulator
VDRLTSMTVFARVAAARSFSIAARQLGISQATASKHVQTLEGWLGAQLLHRTTRRVGLTETGESFFTQCTRILEDMEAARQVGQATHAHLHGSLRITAPLAFGGAHLAALLVDFMAENPDLSLAVTLSDRPVDLVEEGYDLAIRTGPGPSDDAALVIYQLPPVRLTVCAAPRYLAAAGTPLVPGDLALLVCLTDGRHPGDVWRFRGPAGETAVSVSGRLKADNGMLRYEAARTGAGVLLAPEFLVEDDIAAGRLVRLLPDHTPPELGLHVACPANRGASPKVRAFVAFLATRLEAKSDAAEKISAREVRRESPGGVGAGARPATKEAA